MFEDLHLRAVAIMDEELFRWRRIDDDRL